METTILRIQIMLPFLAFADMREKKRLFVFLILSDTMRWSLKVLDGQRPTYLYCLILFTSIPTANSLANFIFIMKAYNKFVIGK